MIKSRLAIFVLLIIYCVFFCQTQYRITFNLHAPGLSADSTVYITGSVDPLGYWQPAVIKMNRLANSQWTKTITISQASVIEYKYTLGSWYVEGADDKGLPFPNFKIDTKTDTFVQDSIFFWTSKDRSQRKSTITGNVKYHRNITAKGLLARDVAVWLPPGYQRDSSQQYPVLYMHDGQNIFDAATSSFGAEWRVDESCDSLIKAGSIPPLIVVAIHNTVDRSTEYIPGEKGSAYMNFVVNRLKPFIDSTYRTKSSAEHTLVGGSSAGGTISFMLVWEYPQVFTNALCFSPALKINDIDYVKVVKADDRYKDVFFYLYNGGVDLEKRLQPGIDEMIAVLKEKKYIRHKDFEVLIDPGAFHSEEAWAKHFPRSLQICFDSDQ